MASDQSEKSVENEVYSISYTGQDSLDRATFNLNDKLSEAPYGVAFSLKYYDPYVEDGADSSGAYIFKYDTKTEEAKQKRQFSKFSKFEVYKSANLNIQCFVGYYRDDESDQMYNFVLRLLPDMPEAFEWEVRLHGIPVSDGFGKEVVANWEFPGFQGGS